MRVVSCSNRGSIAMMAGYELHVAGIKLVAIFLLR